MNGAEQAPVVMEKSEIFPPDRTEDLTLTLGGVVKALGQYYHTFSPQLLKTHNPEDPIIRAAQGIGLTIMSEHGLLTQGETFADIPSSIDVGGKITDTRNRIEEDVRFKKHVEEIAQVAAGKFSGITPDVWSKLISQRFNLSAGRIAAARGRKATEAQSIKAYILLNETTLPEEAIIQQTGLEDTDALHITAQRVARRRWEDRSFDATITQLEVGKSSEILDTTAPGLHENEPADRQVAQAVCDFYGVDFERLHEDNPSGSFARARMVIAYTLIEKLGYSIQEASQLLQRSPHAISTARYKVKDEIETNDMLAAQVNYLERPQQITQSINERIISRVVEITGIEESVLYVGKDKKTIFARNLAMALMVESGHMSALEITGCFNLSSRYSASRAKDIIGYRQKQDKLLDLKIEYIKQAILTEEPSEFTHYIDKYKEILSGRQSFIRDSWPEIDERLVTPEIRVQVYENVERAAAFFKSHFENIIGHGGDFLSKRARRAAILLCVNEKVPLHEIGICFDSRADITIRTLLKNAWAALEKDSVFAKQFNALNMGEARPDIIDEALRSAARYFKMKPSDLRKGQGLQYDHARAVFAMTARSHTGAEHKQIGLAIGRTASDIRTLIHSVKKNRLQHNLRLQADIKYLLNPHEVNRPPDTEDILESICGRMNIPMEKLQGPESEDIIIAKRLTAYILNEELPLPAKENAGLLQVDEVRIHSYLRWMRKKVAKQPKTVLEIDCLRPLHSTSFSSKAGEVLSYAFRFHELTLPELSRAEPSLKLERVKNLTMRLLQKYSYTPTDQEVTGLAEILDMPETEVKSYLQQT